VSKKRIDPNGKISQAALDFVRSQGGGSEQEAENGTTADWQVVEPNLVIGALYAACKSGAAILYGTDRSGFLYSVTLYVSGEKVTKYFHCIKELDRLEDYLRSIIELAG
jgi:hypothetical protein